MALALNNLQTLICHQTKKPNQTKQIMRIRKYFGSCFILQFICLILIPYFYRIVAWPSYLGMQTPTVSLQRGKTLLTSILWPSRLGLHNTSTVSMQKGETSPTNFMCWCSSMGNVECSFIAIWPEVVARDRVQPMGQIEVKSVLMLNWIVCNGSFLNIYKVYLCSTQLFEIILMTFECI